MRPPSTLQTPGQSITLKYEAESWASLSASLRWLAGNIINLKHDCFCDCGCCVKLLRYSGEMTSVPTNAILIGLGPDFLQQLIKRADLIDSC